MPSPAFDLFRPVRQTSAVVFASPHSGREYPEAFVAASGLDPVALRSSEDAFVDRLFAPAPDFGAPLIAARAPRAYIDLNRAADELDPALIDGVPRGPANPRVASGLGVIPRVVANGRPIYRSRLTRAEAEARIAAIWRPYHAALRALLDESALAFGQAILIDCHSMPHEAITAHARPGRRLPEVVLGDRFGATAAPAIVDAVEAAFQRAGFVVARNTPFAGAYIAQAYGQPARRQHVVQVEIDRALYLDEARVVPGAGYSGVAARIAAVIGDLAQIGRPGAMPLAAE
jgi:N-formylglutamate amidohydrolase